MQPLDRVRRTRQALAAGIAVRAMLWASFATLAVIAVTLLAARSGRQPVSAIAWVAAGVVGLVVLALVLTSWRALTVPRVALWIEERAPALQYALVTAVDPAAKTDAVSSLLADQVRRVSWSAEARRAIARSLQRPLVAAVAAGLAVFVIDKIDVVEATGTDRNVAGVTAASTDPTSPFARLVATVRTPAYAGGRVVRIESPVSVAALVGSTVTFEAPGAGTGISADTAGRPIPVQRSGNVWRAAIAIGARPALIRLRHATGDRVIALEPRADSVPAVRMTLPARDTVMRVARGALALSAEAHDDIGLVSGAFEYIVSSGEGESFTFRSGTLGARSFGGAGNGALAGSLGLDALALEPGDMVHLRAVARDGNTVSGVGVGASETRVLRVARASEYDSIAVEGAPPPEADKSLISQRMLIMMTEALERRRPRLTRETHRSESRSIGRDQTRLRKRVGDIIFARLGDEPTGEHEHTPGEPPHSDSEPPRVDPAYAAARDSMRQAMIRAGRSAREIAAADSADSARAELLRAASAATGGGPEILDFEGDETPIVAINRPLLEAYNAMWEAGRELEVGETARALPPMRRALAAIQRARQAERIYLRGKAPSVVVDLARVRLTGKETGASNNRSPRAPTDPAAARRAERLAGAMALAARDPAAAIDSLVLLRVEALDAAPALAAAIADAVDAMRANRDATGLLARARRVSDGSARTRGPLRAWSGAW